jgi:hypothetical protein
LALVWVGRRGTPKADSSRTKVAKVKGRVPPKTFSKVDMLILASSASR